MKKLVWTTPNKLLSISLRKSWNFLKTRENGSSLLEARIESD